jgi:hypothetical protein
MYRAESEQPPRRVSPIARLLPFALVLFALVGGIALGVFVPKLEASWASQGLRPPAWATPLIAIRRALGRLLP